MHCRKKRTRKRYFYSCGWALCRLWPSCKCLSCCSSFSSCWNRNRKKHHPHTSLMYVSSSSPMSHLLFTNQVKQLKVVLWFLLHVSFYILITLLLSMLFFIALTVLMSAHALRHYDLSWNSLKGLLVWALTVQAYWFESVLELLQFGRRSRKKGFYEDGCFTTWIR